MAEPAYVTAPGKPLPGDPVGDEQIEDRAPAAARSDLPRRPRDVAFAFMSGRPDVMPDWCRTPPVETRAFGPAAAKPVTGPATEESYPLLERVREAIRRRHYSRRTEKAYLGWIHRYASFHATARLEALGEAEVTRFLSALAVRDRVSASTQNQALSALLFLYRDVLNRELSGLDAVRAKRPVRLPVVLSPAKVQAVLRHLHGTPWLMACLMYGSGLRLLECSRLRVKDVDFAGAEITVRDGKGRKDRVTMLPAKPAPFLKSHLERVQAQYHRDYANGVQVALPDALDRKYTNAGSEWGWQWVFPAARTYVDAASRQARRHHLHESVLQRSFRDAVRATGIPKPASCHTLRHYAGSRIMPSSRLRALCCLGFQFE